jgi:hypothetical protein
MTAVFLHLSDIHLTSTGNSVTNRAKGIAAALYSRLPSASSAFIVVSGDISQAGTVEEFAVAEKFLNDIKGHILAEKELPVEFVICPGNHDCVFEADPVREAVLKDIYSHVRRVPEGTIKKLCEVQTNYSAFAHRMLSASSLIYSDPLWCIQEFAIEGKTVWLDSLNASWMSSIKEKPGVIFFPYEQPGYSEFKPTDSDVRMAIMHHPLNWYSQANYQGFKKYIHALEDVIISGHEHEGGVGMRSDSTVGECVYIEGSCLQDHRVKDSAFNIFELDLEEFNLKWQRYLYNGSDYVGHSEPIQHKLRQQITRSDAGLQITEEFDTVISDPGANLHHPEKRDLVLGDFYVFPDLDLRTDKPRENVRTVGRKLSSRTLTNLDQTAANIFLEGTENSGKTRLLYQLFSAYHAQGMIPVFLDGRSIKTSRLEDLKKLISEGVKRQYGVPNKDAWELASKSKKIILVDDFDRSPLQSAGKDSFCKYVEDHFSRSVFTVGENFAFNELFSGDKIGALAAYVHYEILPFGYERRGELVRKWNRLGMSEVITTNEWLDACTQAEKLIEAAQLQHIATTVPIMVLSLLSVRSTGLTKEAHNSSFAHYFYFLIVGSLGRAGVKPDIVSKYLNFCMHFSWHIRDKGRGYEVTRTEFEDFCRDYTKKWTKVDANDTLNVLENARILRSDADTVCFTYQYAYYYFLGRYASEFSQLQEVATYISFCVDNLYVRECANTLLFLAHHANDAKVLDQVLTALVRHFQGTAAVEFNKSDVLEIGNLMANAPKVTFRPVKPVEHREAVERFKDEHEAGDGLSDAPRPADQKADFIDDMISVAKTIEIAGALVTNQFSSLSRDAKNKAIGAIFETSLKVIKEFYSMIAINPEKLIKEITQRLALRDKSLSPEEAERITRRAIAGLLKMFSTAWIEKAGIHLSSSELRDNVENVVAENPTAAVKLIQIAQQLASPNRLPQGAIKAFLKTEKDNPCALPVLQTLILKRLYMFETDFDDKDWAISTFHLGNVQQRVSFTDHQRRVGRIPK